MLWIIIFHNFTIIPLFVVISVNGLKDFFEDWTRKRSDDKENNKKALVYISQMKSFEEKLWKEILIGDIIKVKEDEFQMFYICKILKFWIMKMKRK